MDKEIQFVIEQCLDDNNLQGSESKNSLKVRLDKWLWAARFFKTRAIARIAIERGQVYYNGERSKPSREIEIGAILNIRLGDFERTVEITGLSTRRRSSEESLQLFKETSSYRHVREQKFFQKSEFKPFAPEQTIVSEKRSVRFLRRSVVRSDLRKDSSESQKMKVLEHEMID